MKQYNMVGLLGGGFALYGYLPALTVCYPDQKFMLEKRHKTNFEKRTELQNFKDKIEWIEGDDKIIFYSKILILAIPPCEITKCTFDILRSPIIKKIIIEKPISKNPHVAKEFIELIKNKNIEIKVPFLFLYTDWFEQLKHKLNKYSVKESIYINWDFEADHFKNNKNIWKADHKKGGGPLRFYGIHLLAVLASLEYYPSEQLFNDEIYIGVFERKNYPNIVIKLNTKSKDSLFYISGIIKDSSPFLYKSNEDNRIEYLIKFLKDSSNQEEVINKTIELWKQVERMLN